MPSKIQALQQKKADLKKEAQGILDNATDGILSAEQEQAFNAVEAQIKSVNTSLEKHQAIAAAEFAMEALPENNLSIKDSKIELGEDKSMEFASLGDQLAAVMKAANNPSQIDPRLIYQNNKNAAASGLNASTPSDGGFLLQTQFSTALLERAMDQSILLPRCTNIPIGEGFDGLEAPVIDETSRATGSRLGGVQVYRAAEAEAITEKKPKFGSLNLRLEDMFGLCYVTDRLMRNVPAMSKIVEMGFSSEFSFKADDEIMRGTGGGQCLGYLASDDLVTISKETGQAARTLVTENILKMNAAIPGKFRRNGIWIINSECLPQLQKLTINVGTGGAPVYVGPNGLSDDPFGKLLGRPVIDIEQASALGALGDISFVDLSQYLVITQGGIETATSMHVKFLTHEQTFRFRYPLNGQPLPTKKTPYKGAQTQSAFITLEAR